MKLFLFTRFALRRAMIPLSVLLYTTASMAPAQTLSDEIFINGFETPGIAIPLSSPNGADFEYTAQVTIGDQTFAMTIDTASTTLGVAGHGCSGCTGATPLYSPSASATSTGQHGSSMYADGTGWSGPIYSDTIGLGNGSASVSLKFVDIDKANGFFSGENDYQGILGLGPSQNAVSNTDGYFPTAVGAGTNNILSFDLCDNTGDNAGTMWLGGDGGATKTQYTPLVPISINNPFYAFNVDALSLGETVVVSDAAATFSQPVLDTGTSLFYVPTSVYHSFETTLEVSSGFQTVFGNKTFASSGANAGCVQAIGVTDADVESNLPSISLSLPRVTSGQPDFVITAPALDTYIYNGGDGFYCLAIQDGGTQDPSTFGEAFMQAFHTVIDISGNRVGFAPPTTCVAPAIQQMLRPSLFAGPRRPPRPPRPGVAPQ